MEVLPADRSPQPSGSLSLEHITAVQFPAELILTECKGRQVGEDGEDGGTGFLFLVPNCKLPPDGPGSGRSSSHPRTKEKPRVEETAVHRAFPLIMNGAGLRSQVL